MDQGMFGTTIDYYRLSEEKYRFRQFVINSHRAEPPMNQDRKNRDGFLTGMMCKK